MAGYSQTPLPKKLGIGSGAQVVILSAPHGFLKSLEPLPAGASLTDKLPPTHDVDVIVLFCRSGHALDDGLGGAARRLAPNGGLWVAWPKKASGVPTDLDFTHVQEAGLKLGLVDNKVCAIDQVFSGLRFVVRRENRRAWEEGERA